MKIAIPTKQGQVDDHFGHCEYFSVYNISNNKVADVENVPSPDGCGCKSTILTTLKNKGVEIMLAGNMGQGAINKVNAANIQLVRGCTGTIDNLIEEYLAGNIKDKDISCSHTHSHESGHQCNH